MKMLWILFIMITNILSEISHRIRICTETQVLIRFPKKLLKASCKLRTPLGFLVLDTGQGTTEKTYSDHT